jgi:hypothetical protein
MVSLLQKNHLKKMGIMVNYNMYKKLSFHMILHLRGGCIIGKGTTSSLLLRKSLILEEIVKGKLVFFKDILLRVGTCLVSCPTFLNRCILLISYNTRF